MAGVVSRTMLENAFANGQAEHTLLNIFNTLEFPHVHADHPLYLALERMHRASIDILPVVGRADLYKLQGIVTLQDILDSYGVESINQDSQPAPDERLD